MKNKLEECTIKVPQTEEELAKYYRLRYEILRKPWGRDEHDVKDEWEDRSLHLLALDGNGNAIGTGRLQFNSDTEAQIRSMSVAEQYRMSGLGSRILKELENKAAEKNISELVLDSRDHAVGFYEKNGYTVEGPSYTLFGVIPHFRMKKILSK